MIVIHDGSSTYRTSKPIICPKCKRGKIGSIPHGSRTKISKRGGPPPEERGECLLVKCAVCGSFSLLTIE